MRSFGRQGVERRLTSLVQEYRGRRVVVYYWVADAIPLLRLFCQAEVGGKSDLTVVSSLNWLGMLVAEVLKRHGRRVIQVSSGRMGMMVADVQRVLREPAICITADGQGPFGVISPGLVRLIEARDAIAVPLGAWPSRAIRVARPIPCTIPLPWARVGIGMGDPIASGSEREVSVGALERALWVARERARSEVVD